MAQEQKTSQYSAFILHREWKKILTIVSSIAKSKCQTDKRTRNKDKNTENGTEFGKADFEQVLIP